MAFFLTLVAVLCLGVSSLVVTSFSPQVGSPEGGSLIQIQGSGFGVVASALSVTFNNSGDGIFLPPNTYLTPPCINITIVVPDTEISCLTTAGGGSDFVLSVGKGATVTKFAQYSFHYAAPNIATVVPTYFDTYGGTATMYGENFGSKVQRGELSMRQAQHNEIEVTIHSLNDTAVVFFYPSNVGHGFILSYTYYDQSSNDVMINYSRPIISTVSPAELPTAGGSLVIVGKNLGFLSSEIHVFLNAAACTNVLVTSPLVALQALCPGGVGVHNGLVVEVSGQRSEAFYIAYRKPTTVIACPSLGPTTGQRITVVGENFGASAASMQIMVGDASCLDIKLVESHHIFSCRSPSGVGKNLPVKTMVGGQLNVMSFANFSYEPPVFMSVTPQEAPTEGGTLLTIKGRNFGDFPPQVNVTFASFPCNVVFCNHTKMVCMISPGYSIDLGVTIGVDTQVVKGTSSFSFTSPSVKAISPKFGSPAGGTTVLIAGENFSEFVEVVNVFIGGRPCINTKLIQPNQLLQCVTTADSDGTVAPVVIQVGSGWSVEESPISFTYTVQSAITTSSVQASSSSEQYFGHTWADTSVPVIVLVLLFPVFVASLGGILVLVILIAAIILYFSRKRSWKAFDSILSLQSSYEQMTEITASELANNPIFAEAKRQNWYIPQGDIDLRTEIGSGSFGRVYLARWKSTHVAVKTMLPSLASPESLHQLLGEVALLSRLRHPNIVQFFGAHVGKSQVALVLEYCSRGSLYATLRRANILEDFSLRLSVAEDIARGLAYLHTQRPAIIHRDMKSPNVLVDEKFNAKLTDFGSSRFVSDRTMSVVGTVLWIAPEVLQKQHYSEKADIYSLGVILWELTHPGEELYPEMHAMEISNKVCAGMRPPLQDVQSEQLAQLMRECYSASTEVRPSALDVAARINTIRLRLEENAYEPPEHQPLLPRRMT